MSYGFDLIALPAGSDRDKAYKQHREQQGHARARVLEDEDPGPLDPAKEKQKQRLAAALIGRNPDLKEFERDYARIAVNGSISESEARRLFRNIELNDHRNHIQIDIADDGGSIGFSPEGRGKACADSVRILWDCLRVLELEGGYAAYDPQVGRILNLESDYDTLVRMICSRG
ncbi:MAG TPA: hypothetical protein VMD29_09655 [Terracidiphilus sp.]|nr:hypothetical protein [Terracidiphilus sp.]